MIAKTHTTAFYPRQAFDNAMSSLSQKDKMIDMLKKELESFSTLKHDD